MMAEFSRAFRIDTLGAGPRQVSIEAGEDERAAIALRFGLVAIDSLTARADISRSGERIEAAGTLSAAVTQSCAVTDLPVEARVVEDFRIIFVPEAFEEAGEEIELSGEDLDVVFYAGGSIDLGEAVAETLVLALDPYPRAPEAEATLRQAGVKSEEEAGPFGALSPLRDRLKS